MKYKKGIFTGSTGLIGACFLATIIGSLSFSIIAWNNSQNQLALTAFAFVVIIALLALVSYFWFKKYIDQPLSQISLRLAQFNKGNFGIDKFSPPNQQLTAIIEEINLLQSKLQAQQQTELQQTVETARLQTALNESGASIMLIDADYKVIFLNNSLVKMFKSIQQQLRSCLPEFDPDLLIGADLDGFLPDPEEQRQKLECLEEIHTTEIEIAGRNLILTINPIFNNHNSKLGFSLEWRDETENISGETEIQAVVKSALKGELSQQISLLNKTDFQSELSSGINQLLGSVQTVLDDLSVTLGNITNGDLTKTMEQQYLGKFDDLKFDVNMTIANLSQIITQLRDSSELLNTAALEIKSGNSELSDRTEQQASALEETAASMEELNSTVEHNADNAEKAAQLALTARSVAEQGGKVTDQAAVAMDVISASSQKISEIISVIDEIAFQTNLLSLNASVEAARAGEHGRGFAVVATEVRKLATKSTTAAQEIKELIIDTEDKVNTGVKLVGQSGENLSEIILSVKKVSDIVSEIAAASREQSEGISQVNQAVTSMDATTQKNASLAEKTSTAAMSLSEKIQEMNQLIGFFKVTESKKPAAEQASTTEPVVQNKTSEQQLEDDWNAF